MHFFPNVSFFNWICLYFIWIISLFSSFRGFSKEKAIIVFNNQFFVSHPNKIEEKLLLETWKESYTSWFLFKYKYFITDMSDGCVYFTTWTHYYAIRVKNVYNFHNNFYYFLYQNSFSNLGLKYRIWS